jgi:hypothetical protein
MFGEQTAGMHKQGDLAKRSKIGGVERYADATL